MNTAARTVTVIPPSITPMTHLTNTQLYKLRVAAYARVSTDSDEQFTSYEAQIDYYTQYIQRNPEWTFVKVYTDEGISGTNTKRRAGFNEMIEDWKGDVRHNFLRKKNAFTGVKSLTITTPSQWLADQVSQSFLQNYPRTVIPNGIDRTIFRPQSSSLREKYHLEDKKIVLGVANAWNARKGLPDLLTLAGRLGSDYQVVLIGLIEKQLPNIPSNVLGLLRTANQIELAQWYSTADVFVNPTYEETFGLTTVEAQACGTPVVVYETDGCPETVAPGNGRLIPQGDMQALENAVRDVADSNWRADPKKMVRFDKDTVYQGYVKLYENVLSTLGKGRVMAT